MTVSVSNYGNYHKASGTMEEVFDHLTDRHVRARDVVYMKSDGTEAIYSTNYQ